MPESPRDGMFGPLPRDGAPSFAQLDKDSGQTITSALDVPISKPENGENPDIEAGKIELCDTPAEFVPFARRPRPVLCFAILMTVREVVKLSPELLQLSANIFLAGNIICGTILDSYIPIAGGLVFTDRNHRLGKSI